MPVIPTGFAQVNFLFGGTQNPTGAEVTLGVDLELYGGTATDLADDAASAFVTHIMPNLNTSTSLVGALAKFGPSATGPSGQVTTATAGGNGGAACSPNVTYLVQKITNDGGRAGRGRWYLPGASEADVSGNGELNAGIITALDPDLTAFLGALTSADLTAVVLHGAGSPITVPSPITSMVTDGLAATQRKRMRR